MSENRDDFSTEYDRYSGYAGAFDPLRHDRQARRKRKPKQHRQPKRNRQQALHVAAVSLFVLDETVGVTDDATFCSM